MWVQWLHSQKWCSNVRRSPKCYVWRSFGRRQISGLHAVTVSRLAVVWFLECRSDYCGSAVQVSANICVGRTVEVGDDEKWAPLWGREGLWLKRHCLERIRIIQDHRRRSLRSSACQFDVWLPPCHIMSIKLSSFSPLCCSFFVSAHTQQLWSVNYNARGFRALTARCA